ncbi:retron system putative HNH endonuclease [Psychrobacter sp. FBL11]|uniref:Retron system putative HNH endonuclease n=1 Tax=Psychrobacter saeujeotis TaxID=3143436 RepID=A0ABU9XB06_9GAMM|nr:retron system putative HNH endonuclease [uncultured Psychrobacter sp.]
MQKINKLGSMPADTEKGFKKYKTASWGDIPEDIKAPLRQQLYDEQLGICCYCCKSLNNEKTVIEHLKSRRNYPTKRFDYDNLLLSCSISKQCDNAKGSQELLLTPLMNECNNEIKLNLAGELESDTERGKEAIEVLNLNSRKACQHRKDLFTMMGEVFGYDLPYKPPLEMKNEDVLESLLTFLTDISQKSELRYIVKKLTE